MSQSIICEQQDTTFVIRINRPEKKNAITRDMYIALTQALKDAEQSDIIKNIIITGTTDCFTAGNDLKDFLEAKSIEDLEPILALLSFLPKLKKPLIAAVHGLAIGIGTTLLLHCDFVYADQNSQFQLPFINLGAVPEAGSSALLPQLIGHVKSCELLMLGETFDCQTAHSLQLINAITPNGQALAAAFQTANKLSTKSQKAIQLTKRMLKESQQKNILQLIKEEAAVFYECLQSSEAQQAMKQFFKKQ